MYFRQFSDIVESRFLLLKKNEFCNLEYYLLLLYYQVLIFSEKVICIGKFMSFVEREQKILLYFYQSNISIFCIE